MADRMPPSYLMAARTTAAIPAARPEGYAAVSEVPDPEVDDPGTPARTPRPGLYGSRKGEHHVRPYLGDPIPGQDRRTISSKRCPQADGDLEPLTVPELSAQRLHHRDAFADGVLAGDGVVDGRLGGQGRLPQPHALGQVGREIRGKDAPPSMARGPLSEAPPSAGTCRCRRRCPRRSRPLMCPPLSRTASAPMLAMSRQAWRTVLSSPMWKPTRASASGMLGVTMVAMGISFVPQGLEQVSGASGSPVPATMHRVDHQGDVLSGQPSGHRRYDLRGVQHPGLGRRDLDIARGPRRSGLTTASVGTAGTRPRPSGCSGR